MATGLSNKLTGQIGEFLACAELGKRGLIATPFAGNVPEFDLVAAGPELKTIPLQVKTTRSSTWPSTASLWMDIEIDERNERQIDHGERTILNPSLIYICVALSEPQSLERDRFFVCRKKHIQAACVQSYRGFMSKHNWARPKNYRSMDNRFAINDLLDYEDDWDLILNELN